MNTPLVSVILTSYNQPDLLEKAFNSLISQTYTNIEIIIVDDCSTNTLNKELINGFKQLHPSNIVAYFQPKNVGIATNKNTGFKLAKGDFITYLDGDDTYYENKIASEIKTFKDHPDADVVYSNFDIKSFEGKVLGVWAKDIPAQGYIFENIILNKFPDSHTHRYEMFKKYVLKDLNFYDEQFTVYHDLDFMIRYSLVFKVIYNNYIGSSYYKNPESIVSKTKGVQLIEQQEQVYSKYKKEINKHNLQKPFKKYLKTLKLNKLFYLDKPDTGLLVKAAIEHPLQILKIARIANYLYKTKVVKRN